MGGFIFGKILPNNVPNCYRGSVYVFWHKTLKLVRFLLSSTRSVPFNYQYCQSYEQAHSRKTKKHRNSYRSQSNSNNAKLMFTSELKDRVFQFLVRTWVNFLEAMLAMTLGFCWEVKDPTSQCLPMSLSAYILSWYTQTSSSTKLLMKYLLFSCAAFFLFSS